MFERTSHAAIGAFLLGALLLGCSSASDTTRDGASDDPSDDAGERASADMAIAATGTLAEFYPALAHARCAHQLACGFIDDQAACEAYQLAPTGYDPSAGLAAGRVQFDAAQAHACLAAVSAAACRYGALDSDAITVPCAKVTIGQVALNGSCSDDRECAGAAVCGSGVAAGCSATCVMPEPSCTDPDCLPRAAGALCEQAGECARGLRCAPDAQYAAGTCGALGKPGDRCFNYDSHGDLAAEGECEGALVCGGDVDQPTCVARSKAGEPCLTHGSCEDRLICLGMDTSDTPVCGTPRAVGGACGLDDDCLSTLACVGVACARRPGLGEPCVLANDDCVVGFCERASLTCKAQLPAGTSCDVGSDASSAQCLGAGYCDDVSLKCIVECAP